MNRVRKTGLLMMVIFAGLYNQNLYSQAGGAAVPFLLISPDARSSGMGEVGTAIADDIYAIFWNPGGLGFLDYMGKDKETGENIPFRQVSLSYSKWLPQFNADLFYSHGSIGQHFDKLNGTLAFNFVFMNLGEFTRTLDNGEIKGKFLSNEFAVGLSYGTIIATDLGLGTQIRYIQSNLAPVSSASGGDAGVGRSLAFDIGILWKPLELNLLGLNLDDRISLGLNLQNVGPKVTYRNESDPLPTNLRLGTAFNLYKDEINDWKFAADFAKLLVKRDSLGSDPLPKSLVTGWDNPGAELSFGTEYIYGQTVALRAGYFTEPSRLGNRKYWNFGLGVNYDIFRLDFSFINTIEENHPLANTMRFSMLINWE